MDTRTDRSRRRRVRAGGVSFLIPVRGRAEGRSSGRGTTDAAARAGGGAGSAAAGTGPASDRDGSTAARAQGPKEEKSWD